MGLITTLGAVNTHASHGALSSTERDASVNDALRALIARSLAPAPEGAASGDPETWTNLQAAEWTARASERVLAQANLDLPSLDDSAASGSASASPDKSLAKPAGPARDLKTLVKEFHKELEVMEVDVKAVEKKLGPQEETRRELAVQMEDMRPRTGTKISGFARGYLETLQGFGPDASAIPIERLATTFVEARLSSIPVPAILFEARLRMWATLGPHFDKEPIRPILELRSLFLRGEAKHLTFTAGDFFKSYTPLTLWNQETVFNRVDPAPLRQRRLDAEELVLMDRHPDWRMRGVMLSSAVTVVRGPLPVNARFEALAGRVRPAAEGMDYASYWGAGQAAFSFSKDRVRLAGTGLLLWDDMGSAVVNYNPLEPLTFARRHEIGSVSANVPGLKAAKGLTVGFDGEFAASRFEDDRRAPDRTVRDWAFSAKARAESKNLRFAARYSNTGPDFASPGSQTLSYSPGGAPNYLPLNQFKSFGLIGMRDRFLFMDFGRPAFTPTLKEVEMIWPYGDATPNRQGFSTEVSYSLGKESWVKPILAFTKANEVHPVWVIDPINAQPLNVESGLNTATAKSFTGIEAVLDLDLSKALKKGGLQRLQVGYKTQKGEGNGADIKSDTLTAVLDLKAPSKKFSGVGFTFGVSTNRLQGADYFLPDGTARHHGLLDGDALGLYQYRVVDGKRMTVLAGLTWALAPAVDFRADFTTSKYSSAINADYDKREQNWRVGYEARF